jgi:hypothetical protein
VARKDLGNLHPLRENLQQLWQEGLTVMHLLWTFFSHQIQLLRRWRIRMWMYQGPSYPDCPSSEELSASEVEAWIHKVLDVLVNPNSDAGPVPLWRGITSVSVSTLSPIFAILSLHYTRDLVQGLWVAVVNRGMPT